MINLAKRGTSQIDQDGLENILCTPRRELEGKVWLEGLCSIEGNTCVGCVGIMDAKLDRSGASVHSSVVELTSLAIHPFHYLSSLINPTIDWLS